MGLSSRIESSRAEGASNLVAQLASAVFNALCGIKNGGENPEAFLAEMLRNAAKVLDSELHAEAEIPWTRTIFSGPESYQVAQGHAQRRRGFPSYCRLDAQHPFP